MEIDGSYLIIAGEIGIGIFIIMSRLNDTFGRIWDTLFGLVLNTIYIALIKYQSLFPLQQRDKNHQFPL